MRRVGLLLVIAGAVVCGGLGVALAVGGDCPPASGNRTSYRLVQIPGACPSQANAAPDFVSAYVLRWRDGKLTYDECSITPSHGGFYAIKPLATTKGEHTVALSLGDPCGFCSPAPVPTSDCGGTCGAQWRQDCRPCSPLPKAPAGCCGNSRFYESEVARALASQRAAFRAASCSTPTATAFPANGQGGDAEKKPRCCVRCGDSCACPDCTCRPLVKIDRAVRVQARRAGRIARWLLWGPRQ